MHLYIPFHILLTTRSSQSNNITLPKESTRAAKFPSGDTAMDRIDRLLSGILISIGRSLDRYKVSSTILDLVRDSCCFWLPHPNQPLKFTTHIVYLILCLLPSLRYSSQYSTFHFWSNSMNHFRHIYLASILSNKQHEGMYISGLDHGQYAQPTHLGEFVKSYNRILPHRDEFGLRYRSRSDRSLKSNHTTGFTQIVIHWRSCVSYILINLVTVGCPQQVAGPQALIIITLLLLVQSALILDCTITNHRNIVLLLCYNEYYDQVKMCMYVCKIIDRTNLLKLHPNSLLVLLGAIFCTLDEQHLHHVRSTQHLAEYNTNPHQVNHCHMAECANW